MSSPTPSGQEENMAAPRRKVVRCIKALLAISVLTTLFVFVRVHYMQTDAAFSFNIFASPVYFIDDNVKLKTEDNSLSFADASSGQFLKIKLSGETLNVPPLLHSCKDILGSADADHARKLNLGLDPFVNSMCVKWENTVLVVNDTRSRGSRCYSVQWTTTRDATPENCLSLSGGYWYGGSLLRQQQWPLSQVIIPMQPYVSSPIDVFHNAKLGHFGPVLERMWINSGGFGIIADSDEPLHVSMNANGQPLLCLKTQYTGSPYRNLKPKKPLSLKYTVCMDRSAKHVHGQLVKDFMQRPTAQPHLSVMRDPVWSTRGINMNNMTERQPINLKNEILKNKFNHSELHIAGNNTRTVGGLWFDHDRFPHAHQMASEIKSDGIPVSTSVIPVVEKSAQNDFDDGNKLGVFADVAQNKQWGNKPVGLVDVTNATGCQWMKDRLTGFMKESGVQAFHFESGDASLLSGFKPTALPLSNPCDYATHYVRCAHSISANSTVAAGYRSQQFPFMVDIGARNSSWGFDLGLKSIIPSVLTLGLLGYPFVSVGPVGGVPVWKFEGEKNRFALPEEELYIRWLQLSIFLPGLEMSVGPWQYNGTEVTDLAKRLLKRRTDSVLSVLQTAGKEFLHNGAPIIRPLWWMAPNDETAQRIDCEFMVSNKILVAPVLDPGARHRDVYLPLAKGLKWRDELRGEVHDGGQWLRGYKVNLTEIATFIPVDRSHHDFHIHH